MPNSATKHKLLVYCHEYVEHRIANANKAMESAQSAANEEGKSSAGDKYETGRAMMQIERDQAAIQLAEALKLKQQISNLDATRTSDTVISGSLVVARAVSVFISIGIGKVVLDDDPILVVAPYSPLGKVLVNKAVGGQFTWNGASHTITKIL